jgi:hypothetical protein
MILLLNIIITIIDYSENYRLRHTLVVQLSSHHKIRGCVGFVDEGALLVCWLKVEGCPSETDLHACGSVSVVCPV